MANRIVLFVCCFVALMALDVPRTRAVEARGSAVPGTAKIDAGKTDVGKIDVGKIDIGKTPAVKQVVAAGVEKVNEPISTEAQAGVRKYCVNIAAAATDARFSWQSKKLLEVETRIKARIADLDAKQAEFKTWLDRREAVTKEAKETLVGIYAKMRPETAAAQIGALDDEMATAVLAALTPRQASAIFNEITPPERAAKLAGLLASPTASSNDKKL